MQTAALGASGIEVSAIGMATGSLRSDRDVWEPGDENELVAAIHTALDCGITLIDTAPSYGNGSCEELVGKALLGRREGVIVATKCGLIPHGGGQPGFARCLAAESVIRECEASLRRLRVETIDLYQCHWPDTGTEIAETLGAFERLVEHGKVRAVGLVRYGMQRLADAAAAGTIASLQVPFSRLRAEADDDLIPYCHSHGIGVLAADPLARGVLADTPPGDAADDRERQLVSRLTDFATACGWSLRQLAVAWVIGHPHVAAALVPVRRPSQAHDAVAAADVHLTEHQRAEVGRILEATE